jgi:hypothetical protein
VNKELLCELRHRFIKTLRIGIELPKAGREEKRAQLRQAMNAPLFRGWTISHTPGWKAYKGERYGTDTICTYNIELRKEETSQRGIRYEIFIIRRKDTE